MAKQTFTTGQVLTAAQVNSLQTNDFNQTVSVKTAAYTLVAADKGTRIEFNTSGSVTCTVNTGLFDAGDTLIIQNRGAGAVTITAGTATVNTSATLVLSQYDAGTLYFVSASAAIFFNTDAGGGSPLTTKGDLYVYGTSDTRLPVGTNGHTLVADSATTTGLKWGGDWTTWSPTVTGLTKGNGTEVARYRQIGKTVEMFYQFTLGSTSSITGQVYLTPPVTGLREFAVCAAYFSDGGTEYPSGALMGPTIIYPKTLNTSGTYLAHNQLNATTPFTWGTGDYFNFNFSYEAA